MQLSIKLDKANKRVVGHHMLETRDLSGYAEIVESMNTPVYLESDYGHVDGDDLEAARHMFDYRIKEVPSIWK